MDDFASASMLRLLLRAMAAHGLPPPLPLPGAARVPLQHKQQVVASIVRAGGLPLLLRLAQQVQHIEGEPLHQALIGARDPHDFLARWQRLERYVHASHRVLPRQCGGRALVLEHGSRDAVAPMAAESVAVLGVWIGALQAIGTRDLQVEVAGKQVHGDVATEAWVTAPMQTWHLQWAGMADTPDVTDVSVAYASVAYAPLADAHAAKTVHHSAMPPPGGPLPWPEPAAELARWLARDPPAAPRVADAAAALGLSLRTLQRRLATAGVSFSELLGEVRVRTAAAWLARGAPTLAEIGFLCGYADQAHFTREFTRRAGMPPARYRMAARFQ
jgi:AraC-like DNA-binding protein